MIKTLWLAAVLAVQTPTVTVSGRVDANEAMRARVIRVALSSEAGGDAITTVVDSDGSFDFTNVKPGSYTTLAFSATSVSAPMPLVVRTTDVSDVVIRLPEPKTIGGRISVEGNFPGNVPMPR